MDHDHASIRKLETSLVSQLCSQYSLLSFSDLVRELVHNAVDADAKNITVYINLMTLSVVVFDDGEGISQDDFAVVAQQYFTSRDQSFKYFGYKGEALHYMNASLDLYIESKIHGKPSCSLGSRPDSSIPLSLSLSDLGSIAAVTNAFGKIPVRRSQAIHTPKFEHIDSIRRAIFDALCLRPDIESSIQTHDGSLNLRIPRGTVTSMDRYCSLMRLIFGLTLLSSCETIRYESNGWNLTGLVGLAGAVSPKSQFLIVNRHSHPFSAKQQAEVSRLFRRYGFGNAYNRFPVFILSVSSELIMNRICGINTQDKWSIIRKMLMACFEEHLSSDGYLPSKLSNRPRVSSPRKPTVSLLVKESGTQILKSNFNSIRIIGQFDRKFIVMLIDADGEDILCMADQHACDERIKVETLYRTFVEQVMDPTLNLRLRLEYPISFTLLLIEAELFVQYHSSMVILGIDYIVKRNAVLLTHLPLVLMGSSRKIEASVIGSMLTTHMHDMHTHRKSASWNSSISDWYQAIPHLPRVILEAFNSQACKSALKFGAQILPVQMSELVNSWKKCRAPHACAHGRPCLIPVNFF